MRAQATARSREPEGARPTRGHAQREAWALASLALARAERAPLRASHVARHVASPCDEPADDTLVSASRVPCRTPAQPCLVHETSIERRCLGVRVDVLNTFILLRLLLTSKTEYAQSRMRAGDRLTGLLQSTAVGRLLPLLCAAPPTAARLRRARGRPAAG